MSPFCRTFAACHKYLTVISEIDHIVCGNNIDRLDLAVAVFLDLLLRIIFKSVRSHVNIKSSVIFDRIGIRTEMLCKYRI